MSLSKNQRSKKSTFWDLRYQRLLKSKFWPSKLGELGRLWGVLPQPIFDLGLISKVTGPKKSKIRVFENFGHFLTLWPPKNIKIQILTSYKKMMVAKMSRWTNWNGQKNHIYHLKLKKPLLHKRFFWTPIKRNKTPRKLGANIRAF